MPRLLDYFTPLYVWLFALDPALPQALFVSLVFFTVWLLRKLAPNQWEAFANLIFVKTDDLAGWQNEIRALWQALPAAIIGTIYGVLGTGADPWETLKAALLALLAPVVHRLASQYKGQIGKPKDPGGPSAQKPVGPAGTPPWNDVETPPNRMAITFVVNTNQHLSRVAREVRRAFASGALYALFALALCGCSREEAKSAADQLAEELKDPCSDASFSALTGACAAKAAACVVKGGKEAECGAVCDGVADEWRVKCQ